MDSITVEFASHLPTSEYDLVAVFGRRDLEDLEPSRPWMRRARLCRPDELLGSVLLPPGRTCSRVWQRGPEAYSAPGVASLPSVEIESR